MPSNTLAIVNPLSASGGTGRRWSKIESKLREVLGAIEVEYTRAPRDAERIAREAVRAGVDRLVVAGGDGTTNEVFTGLLAAGLGDRAQVAVLPLGTGGDLARKLRVPRDMNAAIANLRDGGTMRLDAGCIRYRDFEGATRTSYFANIASFGLSGVVDRYVRKVPRRFGGRIAYLVGSLMAVADLRCHDVVVRLDGEEVHRGPLLLGAAANGSYFGGGMHIAPGAVCNDGLLDLVVIGAMSKRGIVANLPRLYGGTHVKLPSVSVRRGRLVEAEACGPEVLLDVDGDPLGTLPARIEVLPKAVTIFGVQATPE